MQTWTDEALRALEPHVSRPLREIVWGEDATALNRTEFAQPALFAIEVALFRLLESWGVRPDAVILLDTLSMRYDADDDIDYDEVARYYLADIDSPSVNLNSARLSAMVHWYNKVAAFADAPVTTAPTLLVQCSVPLPGSRGSAPKPPFGTDAIRVVEADHLSLAKEHSDRTAEIMRDWLAELPAEPPAE